MGAQAGTQVSRHMPGHSRTSDSEGRDSSKFRTSDLPAKEQRLAQGAQRLGDALLQTGLLARNCQRFLLMETLCPSESQVSEKVGKFCLGRGTEQRANSTVFSN